MKKKIIFSIVGARPHFIKAAPFLNEMKDSDYKVYNIHTGQHYDKNMSAIFFDELNLPEPDINLGVGSGSHASQTAAVMKHVESLILDLKPEAVVIYGDTNTTLGSALASSKLYIPTIHIEAGVRCHDKGYPEEINRIIIDHISDTLICPSQIAVDNLKKEGLEHGVEFLGDFMYDSFLKAQNTVNSFEFNLSKYNVNQNEFILSTLHREKTTENPSKLNKILKTISDFDIPTLLPMHPRTKACLKKGGFSMDFSNNLKIIEPISYLEMICLIKNCRMVITDSGGLEKEAFWSRKACISIKDHSTWPETINAGCNILTGLEPKNISKIYNTFSKNNFNNFNSLKDIYGKPGAAKRFVNYMGWN